jgi:hypothetical protein
MNTDFIDLLGQICLLAAALPVLVALSQWRRLNTPMRVIAGFLVGSLALSGGSMLIEENRFMTHFGVYWDVVCMTLYFYLVVRNRPIKRAILPSGALFLVWSLIDTWFVTGWARVNSPTAAIETVFVIGLSLVHLRELMLDVRPEGLHRQPLFWFTSSLLIQNAVNLLYNAFEAQLLEDARLFYQIIGIIYIFTLIGQFVFAWGFWVRRKTRSFAV